MIRLLVRVKIYLQRAQAYMSLLNSIMLMYLVIGERVQVTAGQGMLLLVLWLIGMVLVGYLEVRLGASGYEQEWWSNVNRIQRETWETVQRLEKRP